MILAIEDSVSEVVARKLLSVIRPDLKIGVAIGNCGKSYLRNKARELNRTARSMPVFMMVDLDIRHPCPAEVLVAWLHGAPEAYMLFRVAIMEVESWILADRARFSSFLGIPLHRIPNDTDGIDNPKEFLVNIARKSRRRYIRDDLVPPVGSSTKVGPAYNLRLSAFVLAQWDPTAASASSQSLRRAIMRLREAF